MIGNGVQTTSEDVVERTLPAPSNVGWPQARLIRALVVATMSVLIALGISAMAAAGAQAASTPAAGTVGSPLTWTPDLSGLTAPVTFSIDAALPDGLSFDAGVPGTPGTPPIDAVPATADTPAIPAVPGVDPIPAVPGTGAITGTPAHALSATTYTLTATDSAQPPVIQQFAVTITVDGVLSAPSPISATVGQSLPAALALSTTGLGSGVVYAVDPAVVLPAWLTVSSDGAITGTPDAFTASTTIAVTATDTNGATARGSFVIEALNPLPALQQSLTGTVGIAVSAPTVTFPNMPVGGYDITPDVTAGTGLSFDATTGVVSGTPSRPIATTVFTIQQHETIGGPVTAHATVSITLDGVLSTRARTLTGMVGAALAASTPYSATDGTAAGLTGPFAFSTIPALPDGLSIDATTGTISGTPTVDVRAGAFTVVATDARGAKATGPLTITILGRLLPSTQEVTGKVGVAILTPPLTGSGWTTPIRFTITPALPAGLFLGSTTGSVSGIPKTVLATTVFEVTGTDAKGVVGTAKLTLTIGKGVLTAPVIGAVTGGQTPGSLQVLFARPALAQTTQVYEVLVRDATGQTLVTSLETTTTARVVDGLVPGQMYSVVVAAKASDAFDRVESLPKSGRSSTKVVASSPSAGNVQSTSGGRTLLGQRGITLAVGAQANTAPKAVVKGSPGTTMRKAPIVRIPAASYRRLMISGVKATDAIKVDVRIGGVWYFLGTVQADARHRVILPAMSVANSGSYALRMSSLSTRPVYVKLVVRPRVDLG